MLIYRQKYKTFLFRIVQLLQKLRYSNNENSAKRWIWELCQNAKDVCNSTGKVKISINYDEMQRKVFFRHNGKAFSMDNILSLINQASSKDRNDGRERKSGKFGTGFITTHLLSEVVNISGLLEIGDEYSKFTISSDRTGKEKNENRDNINASSKKSTVIFSGNNGEEPYIVKELYPKVEGIAITAKGISDEKKKGQIINMLSALFDVPIHKISVLEVD